MYSDFDFIDFAKFFTGYAKGGIFYSIRNYGAIIYFCSTDIGGN